MAQFLLLRINGDLKLKGLKDYFALVLFELDEMAGLAQKKKVDWLEMMTTLWAWPSFIDQVFKEDSLVESRLRRIAEKNTKKLKFIQCFCKCKCKSISNNLTCDQCQRQGTKYVRTEEGTWRLLTHPLGTLSYILKQYFCKHCQGHSGPIGWHHNWRHLMVAKFLTNASGTLWWPNCLLMQVAPPGGQISY